MSFSGSQTARHLILDFSVGFSTLLVPLFFLGNLCKNSWSAGTALLISFACSFTWVKIISDLSLNATRTLL